MTSYWTSLLFLSNTKKNIILKFFDQQSDTFLNSFSIFLPFLSYRHVNRMSSVTKRLHEWSKVHGCGLNNLSSTDSDIFLYMGPLAHAFPWLRRVHYPLCCRFFYRDKSVSSWPAFLSEPPIGQPCLVDNMKQDKKLDFGANCVNEQLANTYSTTADPTKTLCRQYTLFSIIVKYSHLFLTPVKKTRSKSLSLLFVRLSVYV